jgi:hypothetical protein
MASVHEEPTKGNVSPPLNGGGIPVESEASAIRKLAEDLWKIFEKAPVTEPTNSPPPVGPVVRPDDNRLRKRKRKSEGDNNRLPKVRKIESIPDPNNSNRIIGFLVPMNEELTIVLPQELMKKNSSSSFYEEVVERL